MSSKRKSLPCKFLESYNSPETSLTNDIHIDGGVPNGEPHALLATPAESDNSDYSGSGRDDTLPPSLPSPIRWCDTGTNASSANEIPSTNGTDDELSKKRSHREISKDVIMQTAPSNPSMTPPSSNISGISNNHHNTNGIPLLPPFGNPFFQAQLHEARLQHEQARFIQEAAIRQEQLQHQQQQQQQQHQQQQHQNYHQNQQQFQQLQQQQQLHHQQQQQHYNHHLPHHQQLPQITPNLAALRNSQGSENVYQGCRKSMDDVLKRLTSKMTYSSIEDSERLKQERLVSHFS